MAYVESETECAQHFLDSMLEVEMTEEDGEVDIPISDDPLLESPRALPPIPTFDLEPQSLNYKATTYGNPLSVQNSCSVATVVPNVLRLFSPVPILKSNQVLKVNPVLKREAKLKVFPGNALPTQASSHMVRKVTPTLSEPKVEKNELGITRTTATNFLHKVFKSEYIKNVFVKQDEQSNIFEVGNEEMKYYQECFKDVYMVQYCRLHCTICDKHLGCSARIEKNLTVHKMLKVLTCKSCSEFYGDGNFPCDKGDNCEIYCRWCGQGGSLVCCSFCPKVFCKKCVRRNYGASFLKSIQRASDWACFCCAQKPLWPHRAICRALNEYFERRKSDPKASLKDTTICCDVSITKKNRRLKPVDKPSKFVVTHGQIKINSSPISSATTLDLQNKIIKPVNVVSGSKQSILKSNIQGKDDSFRSSFGTVKVVNKQFKPSVDSKLSTRSLIVKNNILQNLNISASKKSSVIISRPQAMQSSVLLKGETVVTPPGSRMVIQTKPPASVQKCPSVEVSLARRSLNSDMSKISTVKIPHNVQGLMLKIAFPDNRVHFVRLTSDGDKCQTTSNKQLLTSESDHSSSSSFVEDNLEDSFKLLKMLYNKLTIIKEKINSKTKFTEESLFVSAVNKLHYIYEKSSELLKELDKTLLINYEQWKDQTNNSLDVIDLSDEEIKKSQGKLPKSASPSKFVEMCREILQNCDSDAEVLGVVQKNMKNKTLEQISGSNAGSETQAKDKFTPESSNLARKASSREPGVKRSKEIKVKGGKKRLKTEKGGK